MKPKAYHQLMRGIGARGPHKFKQTPKMEYWDVHGDALDKFDELRMADMLPFVAMVYRSEGDLNVGVFLDRPNLDCKNPPLTPAQESANELVEFIRRVSLPCDIEDDKDSDYRRFEFLRMEARELLAKIESEE